MTTAMEQTKKQEAPPMEGVERTRNRKVYIPRVDIIESKEAIVLTAEMPGVDEKHVTVSLEQGVLTIDGQVELAEPASHELLYSEYEVGDYHRVFSLSESIDQDRIEATVRNGVLQLTLPKAEAAKPKQISIKAG
jgi:HSP20 family molecular chaperone IbpA